MKKLFFILLFSKIMFSDFCPEPTFEDEFEDEELSGMWEATKNTTFPTSASLFTPNNVFPRNGKMIISLVNIGTTDDKGVLYQTTSGEVTSTVEFGYGKYEFRVLTAGLTPVVESMQLIWFDGDYYKDHQFLGFDLGIDSFTSLLSTSVSVEDELNTRHNTEMDLSTANPKATILNLRDRLFTIEYTEDSVSWIYDGLTVRQETSATKTLPDKKMRIVFRSWLINELQYNVPNSVMPVETQIDFFRFTPVDEGGKSCDPIKIIDKNATIITGSGDYEELIAVIEELPEDENHLIGFSGEILALSVFKSTKVVWIYLDDEWLAYSPYLNIRETLKKYDVEIFTEIPAYTGFWIQK